MRATYTVDRAHLAHDGGVGDVQEVGLQYEGRLCRGWATERRDQLPQRLR